MNHDGYVCISYEGETEIDIDEYLSCATDEALINEVKERGLRIKLDEDEIIKLYETFVFDNANFKKLFSDVVYERIGRIIP